MTDAAVFARAAKWHPVSRVRRILDRPAAWVTATCGALALLVGAPSIWYPFGRDQGLFYYAAREWLLRDQVLYRDVWDHKPPVIYLVYMTAIAVFGEHPWSIRLLELLLAVPLLGWCASRLAQDAGEPSRADLFAVGWLGVSVCYYGYFIYWDTAQCEIWSALSASLALVAVLHTRRASAGAVAGGALSAMALFTKPPVIFFVALCGGAVVFRARSDGGGARAVAWRLLQWLLGMGAAAAVVLGYFATRHALADMIDILVGANAVYLSDERTFHSMREMFDATLLRFSTMEPFSAVFAVVVFAVFVAGFARRDPGLVRRYGVPLLLALAACGGVVVQLKFYNYHWGTIVVAAGVFAVTLYRDALRIGERRGSRWLAPALYLATAASLFALSGAPARGWLSTAELTVAYATGGTSRAAFARAFDIPGFYANYEADLTGRWLARHAAKGDTLVVRGFEPEIYATSGLHYTGRFFWTAFLTLPTRSYRRGELLREDRRTLMRDSPRFVVALTGARGGIDSPGWFQRRGYFPRVQVGSFTVLERARQ